MSDVDRDAVEARPVEWIKAGAEKVAERVITACRTASDVHLSVIDAFCLANLIQSLRSDRADLEPCVHPSSTGDEGPATDLGSRHVVRWRCDGCGAVHYSDEALAAARAEHRRQSAEVSRLGQQLQRTEDMARDANAECIKHWNRADAAEAERDGALALVGQLQAENQRLRDSQAMHREWADAQTDRANTAVSQVGQLQGQLDTVQTLCDDIEDEYATHCCNRGPSQPCTAECRRAGNALARIRSAAAAVLSDREGTQ
jgi:hypothetical protein